MKIEMWHTGTGVIQMMQKISAQSYQVEQCEYKWIEMMMIDMMTMMMMTKMTLIMVTMKQAIPDRSVFVLRLTSWKSQP